MSAEQIIEDELDLLDPHELERPREVLVDWNRGSNFRRYLLLPRQLDPGSAGRLTRAALGSDFGPYLPWKTHGGVILVPRTDRFEKFFILPGEQIMFARTARDPEHDAALVNVLRSVSAELRLMERERHLKPLTLGKIMCDDCGAHHEHRSRRMIVNHWPVADGSLCAPWQGAQYKITYGETHEDA